MNVYEQARTFAVEAHTSIGQVRKYTGEPYHTHVLRVAELVSTRTQDQEVLAAACLHDVLEDVEPLKPEYGRERILREFGQRVLDLVVELTDIYTKENHPDKNRKTRKRLEAERLAGISEEAKLIKRADLHDNGSSFHGTSFEKTWLEEKKLLDELLGAWES
jgi:guanosine-3',5'-bis(diphosphate) 3'-pyrophosphohydrolase